MKWQYCSLFSSFEAWEHSPGGSQDQINDPKNWSNGLISLFNWSTSEQKVIWENRHFKLEYIEFFLTLHQQASIMGEKGWELFNMDDHQDHVFHHQWLTTRKWINRWHFKRSLKNNIDNVQQPSNNIHKSQPPSDNLNKIQPSSGNVIKWKNDPRDVFNGYGIVHSMGKYLVGTGDCYPKEYGHGMEYDQKEVLKTFDTLEEAEKELQSLLRHAQRQLDVENDVWDDLFPDWDGDITDFGYD